jgi:hypothetical protein
LLPFISKYCFIAVAVHAVTISLIVTLSYFEAFLTSANKISDDVADNFLPLNFLSPSFRGLMSCLTLRIFQATLIRKNGTLSLISNMSRNVNFLGKGMRRLISNLSPYPI